MHAHPSLKIVALIAIVLLIQKLNIQYLLVVTVIMISLICLFSFKHYMQILFRTKYFLVTLLLIYMFTTPGEYITWLGSEWAPTYEGVSAGFTQGLRFLLVIAALSLLLNTTNRLSLFSGIYCLLVPLQIFSLPPEQFTARLWLTIAYVEHHNANVMTELSWMERLRQLIVANDSEFIPENEITIPVVKMDNLNRVFLILLLLTVVGLICV